MMFLFKKNVPVFSAQAVCKRCDFKVNSSASAMPTILRWGLTSWITFPIPPASIYSPHLCHAHYITLGTEEQPDVLQKTFAALAVCLCSARLHYLYTALSVLRHVALSGAGGESPRNQLSTAVLSVSSGKITKNIWYSNTKTLLFFRI